MSDFEIEVDVGRLPCPPLSVRRLVLIHPDMLATLRADLAASRAEVERLREERGRAWAETSRIRKALRAIVPAAKCDGVDLPGVVGAEVERLRGLLLNIDLMAIDDLTHGCEGRLTSQIEAAAAKGENP